MEGIAELTGDITDLTLRQGGPLDYPKVVTGTTATVITKWDICFNRIFNKQVRQTEIKKIINRPSSGQHQQETSLVSKL